MKKYLDDVLILAGCGFLVWATWRINLTAALYLIGVVMIVIGIAFGIGVKRTK